MKIFCCVQQEILSKNSKYSQLLKQVINHVTQRGHEVTNLELLKASYNDTPYAESVLFEKTLAAIHESQWIVAEISNPTDYEAFCIAYALARREKKVVAFIDKKMKQDNSFLTGITMQSYYLKYYASFVDISSQLSLFDI